MDTSRSGGSVPSALVPYEPMRATGQPVQVVVKDDAADTTLFRFLLRADRPGFLGRSPECEGVVEDVTVSRRHARLNITNEGVEIEDLGSTNGTSVDGEVIRRSSRSLRDGARVCFGGKCIRIFLSTIKGNSDDDSGRITLQLMSYADIASGSGVEKVDAAAPGHRHGVAPSVKGLDTAMFDPIPLRALVKDAVASLPLDASALRAFHAAYAYRRAIVTTNEGQRNISESRRLTEALAFALSRRWRDLSAMRIECNDPAPVPPLFKIQVMEAASQIPVEVLKSLHRTLRALSPSAAPAQVIEGTLYAYYRERGNGLNAEPW